MWEKEIFTTITQDLLENNFDILIKLKKYLMDLNRFDEDYIKPGVGEDTDIEWRIKKMVIELNPLKVYV